MQQYHLQPQQMMLHCLLALTTCRCLFDQVKESLRIAEVSIRSDKLPGCRGLCYMVCMHHSERYSVLQAAVITARASSGWHSMIHVPRNQWLMICTTTDQLDDMYNNSSG